MEARMFAFSAHWLEVKQHDKVMNIFLSFCITSATKSSFHRLLLASAIIIDAQKILLSCLSIHACGHGLIVYELHHVVFKQ